MMIRSRGKMRRKERRWMKIRRRRRKERMRMRKRRTTRMNGGG